MNLEKQKRDEGLKTVLNVGEKENHYRLKKKSDDYELNLNRHKQTSDIIKHQHTIDYLNENFPSYPEEP